MSMGGSWIEVGFVAVCVAQYLKVCMRSEQWGILGSLVALVDRRLVFPGVNLAV